MKNKKVKFIIPIIAIILIGYFVVDAFLPTSIENGFYNTEVVNNISYQSELGEINKNQYGVYAYLTNGNDEQEEFVINVFEVSGILNNKYHLLTYSPHEDSELTNPQYRNISTYPDREIKKSSKYYGSVYCGAAPTDCKSITFNGAEANLEHMTFDLNGQKADFLLYYIVLPQNEYPDECEVICTTNNGKQLQIKAVDGSVNNVIELTK